MTELLTPDQAQAKLTEIQDMSADFRNAFQQAIKSGDTTQAAALKARLEREIAALKEAVNPLEVQLNVRRQYEHQVGILRETGLLKPLTIWDGSEIWIINDGVGIEGNNYKLPSYEDIMEKLNERKELVEKKVSQGFTRLLLTPFATPLTELVVAYENSIERQHANGTLLDPEGETIPLYDYHMKYNNYRAFDEVFRDQSFVYYPEFTDNNGATELSGVSKHDFLSYPHKYKSFPGWSVSLIQKPYRQSLPTGLSVLEYRQRVKTDQEYSGETGLTPEQWLASAIYTLEETNTPLDFVATNESPCSLDAAAFQLDEYSLIYVPTTGWLNKDNSYQPQFFSRVIDHVPESKSIRTTVPI